MVEKLCLIKCKWEVTNHVGIDFPNVLILYFFVYAYWVFVDSCPCSDMTVLCYPILSDNNNDSPEKGDRRKQASVQIGSSDVGWRCAIVTTPCHTSPGIWKVKACSFFCAVAASTHGILGILHCLVWKILWKTARDKLCMHCSICLEKENLELNLDVWLLLSSAVRKSFVWLHKRSSWHWESCSFVPYCAEVSVSDSSNCWNTTLLAVIHLNSSQPQEC